MLIGVKYLAAFVASGSLNLIYYTVRSSLKPSSAPSRAVCVRVLGRGFGCGCGCGCGAKPHHKTDSQVDCLAEYRCLHWQTKRVTCLMCCLWQLKDIIYVN